MEWPAHLPLVRGGGVSDIFFYFENLVNIRDIYAYFV